MMNICRSSSRGASLVVKIAASKGGRAGEGILLLDCLARVCRRNARQGFVRKCRTRLGLRCWTALLAQIVLPISPVCAVAQPEQPPNILWIMMDDLRPDALGCYGTPWARTPHLDALAERGVLFERAYAQNVVCRSSRASMLTGQYCHTVKDMEMGAEPEVPAPYFRDEEYDQIHLPSVLARLGMLPLNVGKTHWSDWWQNIPYDAYPRAEWARFEPPLKRQYDLVQIFAPQTFPPPSFRHQVAWTIGGSNPFEKTGSRSITNAALAELDELLAAEKPFFLRVSYFDPHVPILTPPEFMVPADSVKLAMPTQSELDSKPLFERLQLSQYGSVQHLSQREVQLARGSYYGLVSYVDHHIGRIVAKLQKSGQLDNTLIVFNTDQGLQLGEHGLYKKRVFYEQTVAVPLIFSWPLRLPKSLVIDELVELVDFLPTVMDLVGVEVPAGIAGRSLLPLIHGQVDSWRPAVFSEIDHAVSGYTALRLYSGRRVMVRTKEWKLIYFRDPRAAAAHGALYNMSSDPGETRNLYDKPQFADIIASLEQTVDDWDSGERFQPR